MGGEEIVCTCYWQCACEWGPSIASYIDGKSLRLSDVSVSGGRLFQDMCVQANSTFIGYQISAVLCLCDGWLERQLPLGFRLRMRVRGAWAEGCSGKVWWGGRRSVKRGCNLPSKGVMESALEILVDRFFLPN